MVSKEQKAEYNRRYREKNREVIAANARQTRKELKNEALTRYGTSCKVCGLADVRILQIDHVENNGNIERALLGGQGFAGVAFYAWLKKQDWPEGYQTLCANHNLIKHHENTYGPLV